MKISIQNHPWLLYTSLYREADVTYIVQSSSIGWFCSSNIGCGLFLPLLDALCHQFLDDTVIIHCWMLFIITFWMKIIYHPLSDDSWHHFLDETCTVQLSSIIGCFFVSIIFGWKLYDKFSIHCWMFFVFSFWMNCASSTMNIIMYYKCEEKI